MSRNSHSDRYCGAIAIAALPWLVSYYKKNGSYTEALFVECYTSIRAYI